MQPHRYNTSSLDFASTRLDGESIVPYVIIIMDEHTPKDIPQEEQGSRKGQAWFLDELDIYRTEKPYRLRFESPDPSIARTNIRNKQASIDIHDLRSYSEPLSYDHNGFTIMEAHSALTAEDSADEQKVKKLYLQSLKPVLCSFFGTPNVVILEYVVRHWS